jgi:hypothetical protein
MVILRAGYFERGGSFDDLYLRSRLAAHHERRGKRGHHPHVRSYLKSDAGYVLGRRGDHDLQLREPFGGASGPRDPRHRSPFRWRPGRDAYSNRGWGDLHLDLEKPGESRSAFRGNSHQFLSGFDPDHFFLNRPAGSLEKLGRGPAAHEESEEAGGGLEAETTGERRTPPPSAPPLPTSAWIRLP